MSDWFRQKKGFSIERLAALVSVAEHGGIMNAAGGDPNRQSLMSRQIKELEGYFDFTLLDRRSVPHQLTEAGRQIAQHTSQFLNSIERSMEQHSNDRPLVRIAAGESIIQWLLIPALAKKLQQKNAPKIQFLNRSSRKTIDQITNGTVDIGIVKEADARSHLAFQKIATYRYGLIVNPKLVKLTKPPTWESLAGLSLVIQENRGVLRTHIERLNMELGSGPEITVECTSFPQVLDMVQHSACVGILPRHAKRQAEGKGCRWIEVKELEGLELSIGVVWDESRLNNHPAMGVVLRWLFEKVVNVRTDVSIDFKLNTKAMWHGRTHDRTHDRTGHDARQEAGDWKSPLHIVGIDGDELADGVEDEGEIFGVFFFKSLDFFGKEVVGVHEFTQLDKGVHVKILRLYRQRFTRYNPIHDAGILSTSFLGYRSREHIH